ncbi:hypothetical protein [Kitasatospora sp. NBC_01300]|uniref:hypothetical protein n=1 Tax=Kitasatospora sp. NBC_01300 TaxID=2903574 RepID=UPI002F9151C1|nr:hypothetical protein OG556_40100 [Kitasatospora sp. NBC_01300]
MSRYLPDPSIPVAPLGADVHAALGAAMRTGTDLLALAYPTPEEDAWVVSLVETTTADIRTHVVVGVGEWEPERLERELAALGYVSLAHATGGFWNVISDGGRTTPLYPAGQE